MPMLGVHKPFKRNISKSRPDHSKVDWRNLTKNGESFRKFKFFSARFEFSKLTNCDFSAVSAKRSCFIKADLSGSDFTGANLEGANFCSANLTNVNFKGATLKHANFENAIVDGANFINVSINMAKKLKLSESQIREIEEAKQAQKDRTVADLAARKAKKEAVLNQ
jgi:uncharacterized protein YjbI with pentapeptide repeats